MSSKQELHPRTAVINKTQKNQSKRARDGALIWLAAMFPRVFDNTLSIQPLKAGIMEDILAYADEAAKAGISKSKLREAVVLFTRRIDYLTCLKAREMRIDLQGNPVVMVTEDEAEKASNKIKKRIEKSLRNARKAMAAAAPKPAPHSPRPERPAPSWNTQTPVPGLVTHDPHHIERQPMYSTQSATPVNKTAAVVVKHKTARQYDPDAVARLKEKLGLSRKTETEEG